MSALQTKALVSALSMSLAAAKFNSNVRGLAFMSQRVRIILRKLILAVVVPAALSFGVWSQTETASTMSPAPTGIGPSGASIPDSPPVTLATIQALRDALASQELQIQALQAQLRLKDVALAQTPAPLAMLGVNAILEDATSGPVVNPDGPQIFDKEMEGPLTIHFRGINFTPGGYAEAAFVRRSRALGADLPTPFNSVTMPGASQSRMSEFFGSGRQSKMTTFVDGRVKNVDLSSYVSADFLSAGVTSTSTSTNSYTLRLRQAWGQIKFQNGWSFLGGQMWSLTTENGKGISPDDDLGRTNDARPKTIDPSYNVGFVFARQYGVRLTKKFGDQVAIAIAMENPQASLTTHGNAPNFLLGEAGASNSYNTTSTYSFNPSPDVIVKTAFDPGFGRFGHYEVFGLVDGFRDRVFPCGDVASKGTCDGQAAGVTSADGAHNSSTHGGGIGVSGRWKLAKRLTLGLKGLDGNGIGRYGPGGLPDTAINADGTVHLIKNLLGLGTVETHLTKKLDFVGYSGVEYAGRAASFDPVQNKQVGYGATTFNNSGCETETIPSTSNGGAGFDPGSLSNCTADTRALIEGTGGLWYKFYNGSRGAVRFGVQYSYLTRNTWYGVGGDPHGINNMIFTSIRYYLP